MVIYVYNANYVLPERLDTTTSNLEYYSNVSLILDIAIILFIIRYAYRETKQMFAFGFIQYFLSLWNYIDILLIIMISTAMTMDVLKLEGFDISMDILKIIHAYTIFLLFVRLMSFARGVKGTSFMIR